MCKINIKTDIGTAISSTRTIKILGDQSVITEGYDNIVNIKLDIPVKVNDGGTGVSYYNNINSIIVSGPTNTDPLTTLSNGNIGNILTSNGNGMLPTWNNIQIIKYVNQIVVTTDQTYITSNNLLYCIVEVVGGGGGGAGVPGTSIYPNGVCGSGSGGGGGEYRRGFFRKDDMPQYINITIGQGGLGGVYTSDLNSLNGLSGTITSFGTLISANPGNGCSSISFPIYSGGIYGGSMGVGGGLGGSKGLGGIFSVEGSNGGPAYAISLSTGIQVSSGYGGSAGMYSNIASGLYQANLDGYNGVTYGGGGAGAIIFRSYDNGRSGGNGANGIVIITEYLG